MSDCEYETIKQGEVCTINAAKHYGLFNENDKLSYFNSNISKRDSIKIDKHISNTIDEKLPYSLCSLKGNIAYGNCVLYNKNPWLTLNPLNKCTLPTDVELPNELVYNNDKSKIIKPPPVYRYKSRTGYCQERWYDWFSIPDYHLGNKYTLINDPEHPRNIVKCFKPCEIGLVPRDNTNKIYAGKCVSKETFEYGLYDGTFNYLPISLILLLGSNYKSLRKYYIFLLEDIKKIVLNNDLILNEEVYNFIHDTENKEGYDPIKKIIKDDTMVVMRKSIEDLFKIPFDYKNITVPDNNVIKISSPIITRSRILEAYNICKYFQEISNDSSRINEYNEWKDGLIEINGFRSKPYQFKKLLLILKQACNITFNGKSDYSKNYILFTLNKYKEENEIDYSPIEFVINDGDNNQRNTLYGNKKYDNPAAAAIAGKDKVKLAETTYEEAKILNTATPPNSTAAIQKAQLVAKLIEEATNASGESITDNDVSDAAAVNPNIKDSIAIVVTNIDLAKEAAKNTNLSTASNPIKADFIDNAKIAVDKAKIAADEAYNAVNTFNNSGLPGTSGTSETGETVQQDIPIHEDDIYRIKAPLLDEYKRSFIVSDWLFIFILVVVFIFAIYLILVLYNILTPYITGVINFIVLFSQNLYYCIYDVIAQLYNKYTPSEYLKKVAERDYENAEKKVKRLNEKILKDKNSEL